MKNISIFFIIALISLACNDTDNIPRVATIEAYDITFTSFTTRGEIISNEGHLITNKGIIFATEPGLSVESDFVYSFGQGNDSFEFTFYNLQHQKTYYYRAFAQNEHGIGYGNELSFTPPVHPLQHLFGTWFASETIGNHSDTFTYNSIISEDTHSLDKAYMYNLFDSGSTIYFIVNNSSISIPVQSLSDFLSVSGTGTINGKTIEISYRVNDGHEQTNVIAVFTKSE